MHLKVSKAAEHWHSAQAAAAALSKHHFLSEFFLRSAGDHLHQLRPAASSHIFYLFQSSVLLHLHFYTFGKDFPLLPILVTIFLTNQWWLHSTEVFVSFLLNSKSPFLPGWFPLFRRLCKWTRLPQSSWGRKKKPQKKSIGRMGDGQSLANQIPGQSCRYFIFSAEVFHRC